MNYPAKKTGLNLYQSKHCENLVFKKSLCTTTCWILIDVFVSRGGHRIFARMDRYIKVQYRDKIVHNILKKVRNIGTKICCNNFIYGSKSQSLLLCPTLSVSIYHLINEIIFNLLIIQIYVSEVGNCRLLLVWKAPITFPTIQWK